MDSKYLDKIKKNIIDDYCSDIQKFHYKMSVHVMPEAESIEVKISYYDNLPNYKKRVIDSLMPKTYKYEDKDIKIKMLYTPMSDIDYIETLGEIQIPDKLREFMEARDAHVRNYNFGQHSVADIEEIVGQPMIKQMHDFFETDDNIIKWFYTPAFGINQISPYEYCTKDITKEKLKRLEQIIALMDSGEFSAI